MINFTLSVPKVIFNFITIYTDQEVQCKRNGNFKVLIHDGLPQNFDIFEHRFGISAEKSIILINNNETLTTKQEQILDLLRDREILHDPRVKQVSICMNTI